MWTSVVLYKPIHTRFMIMLLIIIAWALVVLENRQRSKISVTNNFQCYQPYPLVCHPDSCMVWCSGGSCVLGWWCTCFPVSIS